MRIALVSEHASPLAAVGGVDAGGQNIHVAALATELGRRGCHVTVHTRRDGPDLLPRVPLAPGATVEHVDAGPARPVLKDDLLEHMGAFAAELSRSWRKQRPDVVHAHFWMSGLAALEAARPLGIPVVQTFHALGTVKRRFQGAADTSPPERLSMEAGVARGADHVVATCTDEVSELAALGADPSRVTVVPCGVDLGRFRPEGPAEARPRGRHRVVVVGRLVPRKGVDDVITAVAGIEDAELVIAGGGDKASLAEDPEVRRLRAHAAALGVSDRIDWRGSVPRPQVPALLRSADAVVCAPWYEPFGIVPVEAAACGVPVVATAVGGMLDSVVHGVTGVHVPSRNPDAIGAALHDLLADPTARTRMGAVAARHARRRFGWDRVAGRTLRCYEALQRSSGLAGVAS